MKNLKIFVLAMVIAFLGGCQKINEKSNMNKPNIKSETTKQVIETLVQKYPTAPVESIEHGVNHVALLWRETDGPASEFMDYCIENFIADTVKKAVIFKKADGYFETLQGHFTQIAVDLNRNLVLDRGPIDKVDELFAAYNPSAHMLDDFYQNKIGFYLALNFPYYSLKEKEELGKTWSKQQWAYARLGDQFVSRIPAELVQAYSKVSTETDAYIASYNIYAGHLLDEGGKTNFPSDMVLLSHWNIRDEIKSNYADKENGLKKQQELYHVMLHIIDQTIPQQVINSPDYNWSPIENKIYKDGKEQVATNEPNTRYQWIINNFKALSAMDEYTPLQGNFIERNFSGSMEVSQPEVEELFHQFLSGPQIKQVAEIIKKRLGRDLQPFDIWYDGFKARANQDASLLDSKTKARYPTAEVFGADMPRILQQLGWPADRANFIASHVTVEPARGSGHALGAESHQMNSLLRTRVSEKGMNYKGYNIAVHEFGHNVEQTISLHAVPYYSLKGVPNTAFTEALAFVFQSRDLDLLGEKNNNSEQETLNTLDQFWSACEIMGVSMVDMKLWKWLYNHPDATAEQLKKATIAIANEVWNQYFAPSFGINDQPILAVYSHMVAYPLYLSAYSFGQLIEFQVEQSLKGKNFAGQVEKLYSQGRLTPQIWMEQGIGEKLSPDPLLQATGKAIDRYNQK
jgi:hypothetical protein